MHMQLFNNAENTVRNRKREGEYWFDLTAYIYADKLVANVSKCQVGKSHMQPQQMCLQF